MTEKEKTKYFGLSKNIDEFADGIGIKEKSIAGAKIFAKATFNVGKFIVTELPPALEKAIEKEKNKRK